MKITTKEDTKLTKKGYKATTIQDECFGGDERKAEIIVMVKYAKKGKRNVGISARRNEDT